MKISMQLLTCKFIVYALALLFVLTSTRCSNDNEWQLSIPKLLLPFNSSCSVNYTLRASRQGCFVWTVTRPDVIKLTPIYVTNNGDSECSREVSVSVVHRDRSRAFATIIAEDRSARKTIKCDVSVGQVHRISIETTTRELFSFDSPSVFEVRAFDEFDNRFSSIDCLPFKWRVVDIDEGENQQKSTSVAPKSAVIKLVRWNEAEYTAPHAFAIELERTGAAGFEQLVGGLRTGVAFVEARLDDLSYRDEHQVAPSRVRVSVVANIVVRPAAISTVRCARVLLRVDAIRHGAAYRLASLPSDDYAYALAVDRLNVTLVGGAFYPRGSELDAQLGPASDSDESWTSEESSSLRFGELEAVSHGEANVLLRDLVLRAPPKPVAFISVSRIALLSVRIEQRQHRAESESESESGFVPLTHRNLVRGRSYRLELVAFDARGSQLLLQVGDSVHVRVEFDATRFDLLLDGSAARQVEANSVDLVNATQLHLVAKRAGKARFRADLTVCAGRDYAETYTVDELVDVFEPIEVEPVRLFVPYPFGERFSERLTASGGSGVYAWHVTAEYRQAQSGWTSKLKLEQELDDVAVTPDGVITLFGDRINDKLAKVKALQSASQDGSMRSLLTKPADFDVRVTDQRDATNMNLTRVYFVSVTELELQSASRRVEAPIGAFLDVLVSAFGFYDDDSAVATVPTRRRVPFSNCGQLPLLVTVVNEPSTFEIVSTDLSLADQPAGCRRIRLRALKPGFADLRVTLAANSKVAASITVGAFERLVDDVAAEKAEGEEKDEAARTSSKVCVVHPGSRCTLTLFGGPLPFRVEPAGYFARPSLTDSSNSKVTKIERTERDSVAERVRHRVTVHCLGASDKERISVHFEVGNNPTSSNLEPWVEWRIVHVACVYPARFELLPAAFHVLRRLARTESASTSTPACPLVAASATSASLYGNRLPVANFRDLLVLVRAFDDRGRPFANASSLDLQVQVVDGVDSASAAAKRPGNGSGKQESGLESAGETVSAARYAKLVSWAARTSRAELRFEMNPSTQGDFGVLVRSTYTYPQAAPHTVEAVLSLRSASRPSVEPSRVRVFADSQVEALANASASIRSGSGHFHLAEHDEASSIRAALAHGDADSDDREVRTVRIASSDAASSLVSSTVQVIDLCLTDSPYELDELIAVSESEASKDDDSSRSVRVERARTTLRVDLVRVDRLIVRVPIVIERGRSARVLLVAVDSAGVPLSCVQLAQLSFAARVTDERERSTDFEIDPVSSAGGEEKDCGLSISPFVVAPNEDAVVTNVTARSVGPYLVEFFLIGRSRDTANRRIVASGPFDVTVFAPLRFDDDADVVLLRGAVYQLMTRFGPTSSLQLSQRSPVRSRAPMRIDSLQFETVFKVGNQTVTQLVDSRLNNEREEELSKSSSPGLLEALAIGDTSVNVAVRVRDTLVVSMPTEAASGAAYDEAVESSDANVRVHVVELVGIKIVTPITRTRVDSVIPVSLNGVYRLASGATHIDTSSFLFAVHKAMLVSWKSSNGAVGHLRDSVLDEPAVNSRSDDELGSASFSSPFAATVRFVSIGVGSSVLSAQVTVVDDGVEKRLSDQVQLNVVRRLGVLSASCSCDARVSVTPSARFALRTSLTNVDVDGKANLRFTVVSSTASASHSGREASAAHSKSGLQGAEVVALTNRVDDEFVSGSFESLSIVRVDSFANGSRAHSASDADQTASVIIAVRRPHFVSVRFDASFARSLVTAATSPNWYSVPVGVSLTATGELFDAEGERLEAASAAYSRLVARPNRADLVRIGQLDARSFELFVAKAGVTILRFAVVDQPTVRPNFVVLVARSWLQLVSVPGSSSLYPDAPSEQTRRNWLGPLELVAYVPVCLALPSQRGSAVAKPNWVVVDGQSGSFIDSRFGVFLPKQTSGRTRVEARFELGTAINAPVTFALAADAIVREPTEMEFDLSSRERAYLTNSPSRCRSVTLPLRYNVANGNFGRLDPQLQLGEKSADSDRLSLCVGLMNATFSDRDRLPFSCEAQLLDDAGFPALSDLSDLLRVEPTLDDRGRFVCELRELGCTRTADTNRLFAASSQRFGSGSSYRVRVVARAAGSLSHLATQADVPFVPGFVLLSPHAHSVDLSSGNVHTEAVVDSLRVSVVPKQADSLRIRVLEAGAADAVATQLENTGESDPTLRTVRVEIRPSKLDWSVAESVYDPLARRTEPHTVRERLRVTLLLELGSSSHVQNETVTYELSRRLWVVAVAHSGKTEQRPLRDVMVDRRRDLSSSSAARWLLDELCQLAHDCLFEHTRVLFCGMLLGACAVFGFHFLLVRYATAAFNPRYSAAGFNWPPNRLGSPLQQTPGTNTPPQFGGYPAPHAHLHDDSIVTQTPGGAPAPPGGGTYLFSKQVRIAGQLGTPAPSAQRSAAAAAYSPGTSPTSLRNRSGLAGSPNTSFY